MNNKLTKNVFFVGMLLFGAGAQGQSFFVESDRETVQEIISGLNINYPMKILVMDMNQEGEKIFLEAAYDRRQINQVKWIASIFYPKDDKNKEDTCVVFIRENQRKLIEDYAKRLETNINTAWKIISLHEVMHCVDWQRKITHDRHQAEIFADGLVWLYINNFLPDKKILFEEINKEHKYPHNTFYKIKNLNFSTKDINQMIEFVIANNKN